MKKQHVVTLIALGIIGAAMAFMIATNGDVGAVKITDSGVTKVFSKAVADQTTSVPIALTEGSGVEHESSHVFQALQPLSGVHDATIRMDGTAIDVSYSSAEVSEASIREALVSAGYAAP